MHRLHHALFSLLGLIACACAQAAIPDGELTVLRHFYDATGGARWSTTQAGIAPWFVDDDPCRWFGIICDEADAHIEVIALSADNLDGVLPPDLAQLTALRALVIDGNRLHGALPPLAGLTALQAVFAQHNLLSGPIPSLAGLDNLGYFAVDHNRLGGRLPSLAGAPNLQYFQVDNNEIGGRVPPPSPRLTRLSATLCPNRFDTRPSDDPAIDAAWNDATGSSPWWSGSNGCAPTDAALAPHVAFATSATGSGDLHSWADASGSGALGLAAADTICRARAVAANLVDAQTFVAWLSDRDNDAYCRALGLSGKKSELCGRGELPAAGPWQRSDGTPFAAQLDAALGANLVFAPLDVDESGESLPSGAESFTATDIDGTFNALAGGADCKRWQSEDDDPRTPWFGSNSASAQDWTFDGNGASCSTRQHLMCVEAGAGPPLPPAAPPARRLEAFVTSAEVSGDLGGVAGADATCRRLAAAADLSEPASYKALVATSDAPLLTARFASDGPWYRLDGLLFAHDKAELVSGPVTLPLNLTETGEYLGTSVALTGASRFGALEGDHNCADFTATRSIVEGALANWTAFGGNWAGPAEVSCTDAPDADALSRRLFCLSDGDVLFRAGFE